MFMIYGLIEWRRVGNWRKCIQDCERVKRASRFFNICVENIRFFSNLLFAENSRASRGSAPWAPGRDPTAGPWTPSVWGARCATRTDFPAHPFFLQIAPRIAPEVSILGVLGEQSPPPPPNENIGGGGGGQTYRFAPPPPIVSSTWKIDNM